MSIDRTSIDRDTLPAALLDSVKAHARVEFARDDDLMTRYIAAALGLVESKCNVCLFAAVYVVTVDELVLSPGRWPGGRSKTRWTLPQNNVRTFTLVDSDADDAADVSDGFELWSPDFGGSGSSYLVSVAGAALPHDGIFTLEVGVDDADDLAPNAFALVARLAASMYENREASLALWADAFAEELQALWRPCV